MAESWEAFFDLVYSVTREVEVKVNANSSGDVLESMLQKIEHCINGVARLDRITKDAIQSDPDESYTYLHSKMEHNFFSSSQLLPVVQEIKGEFPDIGERLLLGMLHAKEIRCSRETLRRVIHDTDPINTSLRWNAKIVRRSYSVPGPNSLWHIGIFITFNNSL